jgi:hypothetical protein
VQAALGVEYKEIMDHEERLKELREDYFRAEAHPWDADAIAIRDLINMIDQVQSESLRLLLEFGSHMTHCDHHMGGRCNCGLSQALQALGHVDLDHDDGWG